MLPTMFPPSGALMSTLWSARLSKHFDGGCLVSCCLVPCGESDGWPLVDAPTRVCIACLRLVGALTRSPVEPVLLGPMYCGCHLPSSLPSSAPTLLLRMSQAHLSEPRWPALAVVCALVSPPVAPFLMGPVCCSSQCRPSLPSFLR